MSARRGIVRVRPQFGLVTDMNGTLIPSLRFVDGEVVVARSAIESAVNDAVADVRRHAAIDEALLAGESLLSISTRLAEPRARLHRRRRELRRAR